MELGICVRDRPVDEIVRLGRFAEDSGYSHIFLPEAVSMQAGKLSGRSPYVSLAAMFATTQSVQGAVGVAAAPFRSLPHLAASAATLNEQSEGRMTLGIGVSHREAADRLGVPFPTSPLRWMDVAIDELMGQSRFGMTFGGGFGVLVGALGPRMVELGAAKSDGVVLNWLTPSEAAATVELATEAGRGNGRTPLTVLYVRLSTDEVLRADAESYDTMDNYHRHFARQGLHDVDAIVEGTALRVEDPAAARARLDEYAAAGLDLVCVYPQGLEPDEREAALAALVG